MKKKNTEDSFFSIIPSYRSRKVKKVHTHELINSILYNRFMCIWMIAKIWIRFESRKLILGMENINNYNVIQMYVWIHFRKILSFFFICIIKFFHFLNWYDSPCACRYDACMCIWVMYVCAFSLIKFFYRKSSHCCVKKNTNQ